MTTGRDIVNGDDGTEPVAPVHGAPWPERGAPTFPDTGAGESAGSPVDPPAGSSEPTGDTAVDG